MDTSVPNARIFDDKGKAIAYDVVGPGDSLKIVYKATRGEHFIDFSPNNLHIWLNGQPLRMVQEITLTVAPFDAPRASIKFMLENIDIDSDTLLALEAIIKTQKEKADGEGT